MDNLLHDDIHKVNNYLKLFFKVSQKVLASLRALCKSRGVIRLFSTLPRQCLRAFALDRITAGVGCLKFYELRLSSIKNWRSCMATLIETLARENVDVCELFLCEQIKLVLRPNQLYKFKVDPNCKTCQELEAAGKQPNVQTQF
jgi:hypothetical protein